MTVSTSSESGWVDVKDTRLYYEVAGQGHPLVLIHAGICDSSMWDEQWETFAQQYRVVRYDVRGFGKSENPSGTFTNRDDLYRLLRHLGIEQTAIVAVSMAGGIALGFTLEHPNMVDALVLVASGVRSVPPSEQLQQLWEQVDAAMTAGDIDQANELELQAWVDGPGRAPDAVDPTVRERVRVMNLRALTLASEDAVEEPLDPPIHTRLGEISVPALIVVGDQDQPSVLQSADVFLANIAGSKKVVMPGTAHLPSMEQPERFNQIVLDFLGALP